MQKLILLTFEVFFNHFYVEYLCFRSYFSEDFEGQCTIELNKVDSSSIYSSWSHLFRSQTLEASWSNDSIFHFSGKRRRVKVGCQILLKHNGLNMEKYFLLFLMLNIILESFVQGAPMSEISFPNSTSLDNEYSNLTVTPETPTPALCR